jgi:hypothetical protein
MKSGKYVPGTQLLLSPQHVCGMTLRTTLYGALRPPPVQSPPAPWSFRIVGCTRIGDEPSNPALESYTSNHDRDSAHTFYAHAQRHAR